LQNSYAQYLAAKALKARNWRFHKRFNTWFLRRDASPQEKSELYEVGNYRVFDFEETWSVRERDSFRFEYQFLDDSN